MTLLIVEDNEQMRRLLNNMLEDVADSIIECADGSQALAAYARCRPDWVLMDIRMPGLDGITATRQIKAAHPGARVVIVTEYDDPQLRDAARLAGACGYVVKEDLTNIRRLLNRKAGAPKDKS